MAGITYRKTGFAFYQKKEDLNSKLKEQEKFIFRLVSFMLEDYVPIYLDESSKQDF